MNLAKQRFQLAYLEARQKGVAPEKIALLDEFIVQTQMMLNQAQMQAPQGLPESPAAPPSPVAGEVLAPTDLMPEMPQTPETPESPLPI